MKNYWLYLPSCKRHTYIWLDIWCMWMNAKMWVGGWVLKKYKYQAFSSTWNEIKRNSRISVQNVSTEKRSDMLCILTNNAISRFRFGERAGLSTRQCDIQFKNIPTEENEREGEGERERAVDSERVIEKLRDRENKIEREREITRMKLYSLIALHW